MSLRPGQGRPYRLCVVCDHPSLEALTRDPNLERLWAQEPDALVELRLDGYRDLTPERLAHALDTLGPSRCLVTFRSVEEGGLGRTDAHDDVRYAHVAMGQSLGVCAIDLEIQSLTTNPRLCALWQQGPALRVASAHLLDCAPGIAELQALRDAGEALAADVVKIVVAPKDMRASEPLLALLESHTSERPPLIGLATGPHGVWSRLLSGRFATQTPWTYTCWPNAVPAAQGQLPWDIVKASFRAHEVTPMTPIFGVVGAPVMQSASPDLHNGWLAEARRPGLYLPLQWDGRLEDFLTDMAPRLGIVGLSVTHPFKQQAYAHARRCSPEAAASGAVNTLWRSADDDVWFGDNTDVAAALDTLERLAKGPLAKRTVVVLGAGGAARAIAFGAARVHARVLIWARRPEAAQALAHATGGGALGPGPIGPQVGEGALVVNCTPVGMAETAESMPIPVEGFAPSTCFFDTIYAPRETTWLKAARALGHRTQNGMPMLVHQARAQFVRFAMRPKLASHV